MKDDIYARQPVDRIAAMVVSQGAHYEPEKNVKTFESDTPIAIRPVPLNVENLRGRGFGRFVVLGLAREIKGKWVVRCSCGKYTVRGRRAILNPANNSDRCEHCRHLAYLKRDEIFRRTGREITWEDL